MDLVSPILDVMKCIMIPTCNHVEDLRTKLVELKCRKEDIERRKQTEVGSDKEVTKEVEHWLGRVEAIVTEIQKVEEKFRNVSFMCRSCLSKRVQKRIEEVDKVLEKGKFPEGIVISKPPARGMILPTDQHAEGGQNNVKFREHLEEKILGYLMADDVGRIGVCGLGGVGKTTLAKSINNKMSNLQESKFDKVIWAPFAGTRVQNIKRNLKRTAMFGLMLLTQFVSAGSSVGYLVAINSNFSLSILTADRYTIATIFLAPLAYVFENGKSWYEPFWDQILGYWKANLENPGKVLFLKYEDVMKDPVTNVRKLAEFMGYPFSAEEEEQGTVEKVVEMCSFEFLSNLEVNKNGRMANLGFENKAFFRKGKVGDWKHHLTPEMAERLNKIVDEKLGAFGLTFDV